MATPKRDHGSPTELDHIDKAIIRALQLDGRAPYSKLGPAVGLSQAAVRQRVQRLIESGVMQVVAVTDPATLGFAVQAMVAVSVSGDVRTVADVAGPLTASAARAGPAGPALARSLVRQPVGNSKLLAASDS